MDETELKKGVKDVLWVKEEFRKANGRYPEDADVLLFMTCMVNHRLQAIAQELTTISKSIERMGKLTFDNR